MKTKLTIAVVAGVLVVAAGALGVNAALASRDAKAGSKNTKTEVRHDLKDNGKDARANDSKDGVKGDRSATDANTPDKASRDAAGGQATNDTWSQDAKVETNGSADWGSNDGANHDANDNSGVEDKQDKQDKQDSRDTVTSRDNGGNQVDNLRVGK